MKSLARTDVSVWGKRNRLGDFCLLCSKEGKETFVENTSKGKNLLEAIFSYSA